MTLTDQKKIPDRDVDKYMNTPLGVVKFGENQRNKFFNKKREKEFGMTVRTLENPNVVLIENDTKINSEHDRDYSLVFVKSFNSPDGEKIYTYSSITVKQDGKEVSISSHHLKKNQLRNKLKNGRLLFDATALDASANTSAGQPYQGGSLSSNGKSTNIFWNWQRKC